MDFVRRILQLFNANVESTAQEIHSFIHELNEDGQQYVVTVHAEPSGYLTFCILSHEEWTMITDICQLTSKNVEEMIRQLSDNDEITSIIIDPRDI